MKIKRNWKTIALMGLFLFCPMSSMADPKEVQIGEDISQGLEYLLGFVGPNRNAPEGFKPEKIGEVLKFIQTTKDKAVLYYPPAADGASTAYFEVDVSRSLPHLLRLTDNPQVPAVFTAPSTVRLTRWISVDTPGQQRPMLWEQVAGLSAPVAFSGIEHLVNTPDQNTGAYYEYDLARTLILTQAAGHKVLISLSRQQGVSEAGKKGIILGKDGQWDYLYTGQPGLNRFGLGWVDSYMYDSYSVSFYLESSSGKPQVRFAAFKWLKAGWSNINFVKRTHIYFGLQRFAEDLKAIVEHPGLAEYSGWSDTLAALQGLSVDRLRQIVRPYLLSLQQQVESDGGMAAEEVEALFKQDGYLQGLSREDLQSIVALEYLKQRLGKLAKLDLAAGASGFPVGTKANPSP